MGMAVSAVLAWLLLLWVILPRADSWRDTLAQQATRALGVNVQIGQVVGHREGWWPVLTLRDVRLLDARGQAGLSLSAVRARVSMTTLSPRALADRELRLAELTLVKPALDVRRDAQGQ